ncbi:MAG: hypothetical protein KA354_03570 [Phycisphaerae bacterium]|nr:hypothetical protein [Phycisphaerae bacterium]
MAEQAIQPAAIGELAKKLADKDFETARAGKRQLWEMVRRVGRPGNEEQCRAVAGALLRLTGKDQPVVVRRECIWMLSEIAGEECVDSVAAMLSEADLREDARMVLERLPGDKSLVALKAGLAAAPPEFQAAVAVSLRIRGVEVPGLPDEKLKPCRQTRVKAAGG